jgi:anti-sigma factor (TIGR02949 family)
MSAPDRYTCEEAFRRISDYLDRALNAEEMRLVREHLETCAVCAREFNYEASVLREVRSKLEHLDVPADLIARISDRLRQAEEDAG